MTAREETATRWLEDTMAYMLQVENEAGVTDTISEDDCIITMGDWDDVRERIAFAITVLKGDVEL